MKRNLIFIAMLTIATVASAADSITFGSAAPAAGTQWDDRGSYAMSITTSAGGRSASSSHNVTRDKTCSVEALDNAGRMDAVSVTYHAASAAGVAGKSYRVTSRGAVTYASGTPASPDEVEFVRADNATFGQFRAYDRIFGGRTFTIGQSYSPNRNDAEELLNVAEGTRLGSIALTLLSASDGVATFDLSMTIESNPKQKKTAAAAGGEMTLRFDGTLKMTIATARPLLLDVNGTLSGKTKKPTGSHAGEANGTASIHVDYGF